MIRLFAFPAMMALAAATPAVSTNGAALCWNGDLMTAARIRQFEAMMTGAALRCALIGHNLSPAMAHFVAANATSLQRADKQLAAHFEASTTAAGHKHYDALQTRMNNLYGTAATDADICQTFRGLAESLAAAPEEGQVAQAALALIPDPVVDGPVCTSAGLAIK